MGAPECLNPEETRQGMWDYSSFIKECEGAPRLNGLADFFASTASGQANRPLKEPQVDRRLLNGAESLDRFIRLHKQRQATFDQHFYGSIPYCLEEECRLGHAIFRYSQKKSGTLHLYTLGTAEGTMARTVSELSAGRIESLSCSPNVENYKNFLAHGNPPHASFFIGPFHHMTRDLLSSRPELRRFLSRFDIIFEDTTFQMYSPSRSSQIGFVTQHLKEDGLFICIEKFRHADFEEYRKRELQKDNGFKARYFSRDDVVAKEKIVLTTMNENEVTLDEMAAALQPYFRHCYITWNSGNFYTLVASNSLGNLNDFITGQVKPALPDEYVYESLPRPLFNGRKHEESKSGAEAVGTQVNELKL